MTDVARSPAMPSPTELRQRVEDLRALSMPEPDTFAGTTAPQPVSTDDRSKNVLRPETFAEVIGQEAAVAMMTRVVETCKRRGQSLDHVLLVGGAGTGKSTFSHVIAHELGAEVYEVEAPISRDTLLELRLTMNDGDILRIEEIHQQGIMERRGLGGSTQPEVLYAIMEDRVMPSGAGLLDFPDITIIGTTTDEGLLPDPFLARFPLRPRLEPYGEAALAKMARWNGDKLGLVVTPTAADLFAAAARGTPRQVNNYVKNGGMLADDVIDDATAHEVLSDLNGVTDDGLTLDMQNMLIFLYTKSRRETAKGVSYRASVNTIATGIGKSRDSKAIALRVEPYLIEKGYVQIGQGRVLTDAGIERAKELTA